MPRLIPTAPAATPIDLPEFAETVDAAAAGPLDEAALAALAPVLARLGANRRFLGDFVLRELEERCVHQVRENRYSAQVLLLHQGRGWFARACFWPAADDPAVRAGGLAPFFYGVPHDHNFSFLTTGYLGPGYWSDYYERDPDAPDPVPGDAAGLVPAGRRRLGQGETILYREARDVHCQWPADAFSVSINIMPVGLARPYRGQYRYDVAEDVVAAMLTRAPIEALLPLAAHLGGGAGAELIDEITARHPCVRTRFAALGATADLHARRRRLEEVAGARDGPLARLAEARLAALDAGAGWRAGSEHSPG